MSTAKPELRILGQRPTGARRHQTGAQPSPSRNLVVSPWRSLDEPFDDHVELHSLRFHYRASGDQSTPEVVLLHGIMGHSREWDSLVEILAPTVRVLALDLRGHGETDWASEYTARGLAADVAAFIEKVGVAPVHIVGHSMGAMAAAICAAQRPELVDRLVLIDIGPDSLSSEWALTQLPAMLASFGHASYAQFDDAIGEWLDRDPFARKELLRHYVEHNLVRGDDGRLRWRFDGPGLAEFVRTGATEAELWKAFDEIHAPTLLVRGQHSDVLTRRTADELVTRTAQCQLTEIPAGAHDLSVEQPVRVAVRTLRFLMADTFARHKCDGEKYW